jgi:hypothetical protein
MVCHGVPSWCAMVWHVVWHVVCHGVPWFAAWCVLPVSRVSRAREGEFFKNCVAFYALDILKKIVF